MERLKTVYLAGGITGLTIEEAFSWREEISKKFPDWLKPISPLRGKKTYLSDMVGDGTLRDHYNSKLLSTPKGITCRDRYDAMNSDAMIVNFLGAKQVSIGTVLEIGWADSVRKPIIVVMEENNLHQHAMIKESVGFITDSLDEAADLVIQLLKTGN